MTCVHVGSFLRVKSGSECTAVLPCPMASRWPRPGFLGQHRQSRPGKLNIIGSLLPETPECREQDKQAAKHREQSVPRSRNRKARGIFREGQSSVCTDPFVCAWRGQCGEDRRVERLAGVGF